jgi:hypothetical protein
VVGTTDQIFCQDVDINGEAHGVSDVIPATDAVLLVEGIAWSGPGCTGTASVGSVDRYIVVFAGPGPPLLLPAP